MGLLNQSSLLLLVALVVVIQGQGRWSERLWGTNIHFTQGRPGETDQLARAFQVARMDFEWGRIERTKGVYNWNEYDILYSSFQGTSPRKVVCYWILDYSNSLYNGGLPPTTTESIEAFVNFAVASIEHFQGKNIIWEMWNEPNGGFWPPKANATQYARLAYAVGSGIRSHPTINKETYVGPATSTIDLKFLKEVFELDLLKFFDAVSVHPYRGGGPESVMAEYDSLRSLIQQYAGGKDIPILSGEWGWSTCIAPCTPGVASIISEHTQAQYLSRQWLVNALSGVPVSIFYDFFNDGPDPTYREQNFGTLENQYHNATLPHIPKPSYNAAFTLARLLGSWNFLERLPAANKDPETFVLAFGPSTNDEGYAVWKTSGHPESQCDPSQRVDCGYNGITKTACEGRGCCFIDPYKPPGPQCYFHPSNTTSTVQFSPKQAGCFQVIGMEGETIVSSLCTQGSQLSLVANDSPRYLIRRA